MNERVQVYYDGLCHLCSREIQHYLNCEGADQIAFVDITKPEFSAAALGMDPEAVNRHLHVRRSDGSLAVGIDAFVAIWEVLPRYRFAARAARLPIINPVLRLGYAAFARVRPLLPKRKTCEIDPLAKSKLRN